MSALIPALIQLAMRGRGGGGGGGGGGSRGKQPFDAQGYLDKEAGKDQLNDPFDFTQDRSNQQFWSHVFDFYGRSAEAPQIDFPKPPKE